MPRLSRARQLYGNMIHSGDILSPEQAHNESVTPTTNGRGPGRPKKHLLQIKELAAYLAVSRGTVYNLLHEEPLPGLNPLPCYRVGYYLRFDLQEVLEYLDRRRKARQRLGYE